MQKEHIKSLFLMWTINPSQDSWFHTRKNVLESKTFSIQRNIGDFHKDFYIQQIENYPTTVVTAK